MIAKWGLVALRLVLAGIFFAAAVGKIVDPAGFARAVYNYQLLPDAAINLTALILPWLEFLLAACLLFGFWLPGATLTVNALFVVFLAALLFNLQRGLNVHCGCFTTSAEGDPETTWYLIRDSGFLILGLLLFLAVFTRKGPARGKA